MRFPLPRPIRLILVQFGTLVLLSLFALPLLIGDRQAGEPGAVPYPVLLGVMVMGILGMAVIRWLRRR